MRRSPRFAQADDAARAAHTHEPGEGLRSTLPAGQAGVRVSKLFRLGRVDRAPVDFFRLGLKNSREFGAVDLDERADRHGEGASGLDFGADVSTALCSVSVMSKASLSGRR
jgi:hypothetical protein